MEQAILKTLVYFDIFNYPLTLMEVYKWLNTGKSGYSLIEVEEALNNLSDKIEAKNGFYFLKGKEANIETRLQRYSEAEVKFKRAIKFIKLLRFIPFIKMIAVCNSLSYSNVAKEGDIDLFIIASPNRLWLARFLTVGFLKVLGVRPRAATKEDALDANFFLAEDSLNIKSLQLSGGDIYLTYWLNQLAPVFNPFNLLEKFQAANAWVKQTLPNGFGYVMNARRKVGLNWFVKTKRFGLGLLLNYDFWEKLSQKYQLKIMPQDLKEMMNNDTRVAVNQNVLKFHREDRRAEYFKKYQEKLIAYELS